MGVLARRFRRGFWGCLLCAGSALASADSNNTDVRLPDAVTGQLFELSQQKPQPTLLVFWRVDCEPCLGDMPLLAQFATTHPHVRVLGVSLSRQQDTAAQWQALAMPFPTLVNTGFPAALLERFGNTLAAVPYTVLLQPDRRICWSLTGVITLENLQDGLQACGVLQP